MLNNNFYFFKKRMNEKIIEKLLEKYLFTENANQVNASHPYIDKYVILRGYDSGVRAWVLIDATPWAIRLRDARMLRRRRTSEGTWLSWLAECWLNEDRIEDGTIKINKQLTEVMITDNRMSTIFPCSEKTEKQIRNAKVW